MHIVKDIVPGPALRDSTQGQLNRGSTSRPPRVELTGILIPCHEIILGELYTFLLISDSKEYHLLLNDLQSATAQKLAWERVEIRGYLDFATRILEVERVRNAALEDAGLDDQEEARSYYSLQASRKVSGSFVH